MFFDKSFDTLTFSLPEEISTAKLPLDKVTNHAFVQRDPSVSDRSIGWVRNRDILTALDTQAFLDARNRDIVETVLPLTLRVDTLSVNAHILHAHLARAIQEECKRTGKKKLTKDQRLTLEDKTKAELLQKQTPKTAIIEVLADITNHLLFVAASPKAAQAAAEIFGDTLSCQPKAITPTSICKRTAETIPGGIEQLASAKVNPENGAASAIGARALTYQFLLWLWAASETHDHLIPYVGGPAVPPAEAPEKPGMLDYSAPDQATPTTPHYYACISGDVVFRHLNGDIKQIALNGERATSSAEATSALTAGAFPISYDFAIGPQQCSAVTGHLLGDLLHISGLKIPGYPSGRSEIPYDSIGLLVAHLRGVHEFMVRVFSDFLTRRLIPELWDAEQALITKWLATRSQPDAPKLDPNEIQRKLIASIRDNLNAELEALNNPKES